ncbi:ABC transporter ATP-binding protein [Laceyella putida]|uniref:ABC transporter ATP-binding protein n=1 Tax=Laceyella putida TaxID=110101 RepID=A0ABW2RQ56_9BACL
MVLKAKDVTVVFGQGENQVVALNRVNLEMNKGEFVSIMGASGSGKTTLLQLLGGLDQPTSGEILVSGTNITKMKEKELAIYRRKKIGFVFQQFNLIPVLTAEENVTLPLLIDKKNARIAQQKAQSLLELVGLKERRHHFPSQLSGGQQQRVAIARALITEPSILLADEPTGALDSETSRDVIQLLKKMCGDLEQTCIVVTHDPFIAAYSDRVIILADGMIQNEIHLDSHSDIEKNVEQLQRILVHRLR